MMQRVSKEEKHCSLDVNGLADYCRPSVEHLIIMKNVMKIFVRGTQLSLCFPQGLKHDDVFSTEPELDIYQ